MTITEHDYDALSEEEIEELFGGEWPYNTQEMLAHMRRFLQDAATTQSLAEAELNETRAQVVFFAIKEIFEYYAETHNHAFDDMKAALLYGDISGEARDLDTVCQALRRVLNRLAHRCVQAADLWADAYAIAMTVRARDLEAQSAAAENQRAFMQIEKSAEVARNAADRLRDPAMRRAWADEKLLEYALPPRPID